MTTAMPDSTTVANIPPALAAKAVLGYEDGDWPTADELRRLFPSATVISLTVKGATLGADGCDVENGDLTPESGADWCKRKLAAAPSSRPVMYADLDTMPDVIAELLKLGITRASYRIHTAHYGAGKHICSPATCTIDGKPIAFSADATQWTDEYPGTGGKPVDMSLLDDNYFTEQPGPIATPAPGSTVNTEVDVQLPTLQQGAADKPGGGFYHVRRLQALLALTGGINNIPAAKGLAVDGQFGAKTDAGVRAVEEYYKITEDGIAGPEVWSVLLTGAA